MVRRRRRRRTASTNGLGRCSNPFTDRDITPPPCGASISPSPARQRSGRWACPRSLTGRSSAAEVMSAIYEQDFLLCSFGGRPRLSAHHALATLNEIIAGGQDKL